MKDGWELRLAAYIEAASGRSFAIGKHDCLIFTNEAVRAMTGEGFADDWLGAYTTKTGKPLGRAALRKKFGFDSMVEAMDARLRRIASGYPPRGSIVGSARIAVGGCTGLVLGVSLGDRLAFADTNGVTTASPGVAEYAWGAF